MHWGHLPHNFYKLLFGLQIFTMEMLRSLLCPHASEQVQLPWPATVCTVPTSYIMYVPATVCTVPTSYIMYVPATVCTVPTSYICMSLLLYAQLLLAIYVCPCYCMHSSY